MSKLSGALGALKQIRLGIATCIVLLGALAALPLCVFVYVSYATELKQVRAEAVATQARDAAFAAEFVRWRLEAVAMQMRLPGADEGSTPRYRLQLRSAAALNEDPLAIVSALPQEADGAEAPSRQVRFADLLRPTAGATALPAAYLLDRDGVALTFGGPPDWGGRVVRGIGVPGPTGGLAPTSLQVAEGWRVAVPLDTAGIAQRESALQLRFLIGGSLALLVGLCLLHFVAQHLRRQIDNVVTDFGESDGNSVISEFAQIGGVLATARETAGRTALELERARHDTLTGLPGRELFLERADAQLRAARARDNAGVALLYIDLDGFKAINDTYGHAFGDQILRHVATRLRDCVRAPDAVGRLGGDEFVVCVAAPFAHLQEIAGLAASRISEGIASIADGLGCSIGWAITRGDSHLMDLLHQADQAMYVAKGKKAMQRRTDTAELADADGMPPLSQA